MVNWISSWLRGIVVAIIISTITELILPEGNIKKYIKTTMGVFLLLIIISPIINKLTGNNADIAKYIEEQTDKLKYEEYNTTLDTNYYIETTYIANIKEDITNEMKNLGYIANNIEVEIEKDTEKYGNLKQIKLTLNPNIRTIKPVEINVGEESNSSKAQLEQEELIKIKNYIKERYKIEESNIIIN